MLKKNPCNTQDRIINFNKIVKVQFMVKNIKKSNIRIKKFKKKQKNHNNFVFTNYDFMALCLKRITIIIHVKLLCD